MSYELRTIHQPTRQSIEKLALIYPDNPFFTYNYSQARKMNGDTPVLFEYLQDGKLINGFIAFENRGVLNRRIEIPSFPPIVGDDAFWEYFINVLMKNRFNYVHLGSYGSPEQLLIPEVPEITEKRERCEYLLDLSSEMSSAKISSSHKRNIKKARSTGIAVRQSGNEDACLKHLELMDASMERRNERGEKVQNYIVRGLSALIRTGAGRIHQATFENAVLSSIFILEADKGIYYHSAGTSKEGMSVGASHYLIYSVADHYGKQGKWLFNLGGASRGQTGLERFKKGFGARAINLVSFDMYLGGYWKKIITTGVELLRGNGITRAIRKI